MTSDDKPDFLLIVQGLAATFRQEPTEALLLGYWMGQEDLELSAVKRSAAKALRTCRFLPSVVELRELAGVVSPASRAVLAWEAFKQGIRKVGIYGSPDFDDPVINATVRNLGGWEAFLIRMEEEGDKWPRKDFENVYVALSEFGVGAEQAAPLVGIVERENRFGGHLDHVPMPTRVLAGLAHQVPQQYLTKPEVSDDRKQA